MDELAASLATSFSVSNTPNSTAAEHPRFSEYKRKGYESNQEKRRRQILKSQKDARFDFMQHIRSLAANQWDDQKKGGTGRAKKSPGSSPGGYSMEVDNYYRPGRYYKDQLMLSEWMVEVPEDFEDEWLLVPCPVGKRNLVVASNGITTSYSKGGWQMHQFKSNLPGGNKQTERWNRYTTLLDCIYSEITKTFYVLDMMCWKEMPLYESETEFRFYWMHDRFGEIGNSVTNFNKSNQYRFEPLPNFNCQKENIAKVMQADMKLKLDGLLFYHKRTHYLFGSTPMVVWLKAYMLPDILGIAVPANLMAEKPPSYTTFEAHTVKVQEDKIKEQEKAKRKEEERARKRAEKRQSRGNANTSMEVVDNAKEDTVKSAEIEMTGDKEQSNLDGVSEAAPNRDESAEIEMTGDQEKSNLDEVVEAAPNRDVMNDSPIVSEAK